MGYACVHHGRRSRGALPRPVGERRCYGAGIAAVQPLDHIALQSKTLFTRVTVPDGQSIVATVQTRCGARSTTLNTCVVPRTLMIACPSDIGLPLPQCSTMM